MTRTLRLLGQLRLLRPRPERRLRCGGRAGGFTLLEVMAALVIFLTGVVFVLALFTAGLAQHKSANQSSDVSAAADWVRREVGRTVEATVRAGIEPGDDLPEKQPVPGFTGLHYTVERLTQAGADEAPAAGSAGRGVLAVVFVYALDAGRQRGKRFTFFFPEEGDPDDLIRRSRGEAVAPASGAESNVGGGETGRPGSDR